MKRSLSFLIAFSLLSLFLVPPLQALAEERKKEDERKQEPSFVNDNLFLFANLSANGLYSKLLNGSAINGGYLNGYVVPAVKINDRLFFMLIASGFYKKSKQVYKEDKGSRVSSEALSFTLTPKLKINMTEAFSVSPSIFVTRFLSKQTTDVKWGKDLYDYRDTGYGVDFSYEMDKTKSSVKRANFGVQAYKRVYPNFISLLSLSGLGNIEEKEKDYDGVLVTADYGFMQREGLSHKLFGTALFKEFVDKKIENEIGSRDQKWQRDQVYTLGLDLTYRPDEEFAYQLTSTGVYNKSNQHLAEGTFPAISFRKDYFTYYSIAEKGEITYTRDLENDKEFSLGGSYSITYKRYIGRQPKDSSAVIMNKKQIDIDHEFGLNTGYKFHKHWEAGASASLQSARSNNKDESSFRYNYDLLTVYLGITYNY